MTTIGFTRMDASKEKTVVTLKVQDLTSDGLNYPAILTTQTAIAAAIGGVTDGNMNQQKITASELRLTNVVPTDSSRREMKWEVSYQDNITYDIHEYTFGCADWTNVNRLAQTDFWDLNDPTAEMTAFVDAINADVKSPLGNAITIISIEDVGRNN